MHRNVMPSLESCGFSSHPPPLSGWNWVLQSGQILGHSSSPWWVPDWRKDSSSCFWSWDDWPVCSHQPPSVSCLRKLMFFWLHIQGPAKRNTMHLYWGHRLTLELWLWCVINTLATGYGDFRTSVAKRRQWATEISVFPYGWMEEGVGFVMC